MTIDTATREVSYVMDGATLLFAIPFRWLDNSWITITRRTGTAAAVTLVSGVDYTLAGVRETTGSVTLVSGGTLNDILLITRAAPITQATVFRNRGAYDASNLEDALDKLTVLVGQVFDAAADAADRELRVPAGETVPNLPAAVDRASKFLYFDADGNPTAASNAAASFIVTGTAGALLFLGPSNVITRDAVQLWWDDTNNRLGVGTASSLQSKLNVATDAAELSRGLDIYHYSDQTNAANQRLAFTVHNYTDAVSGTIDAVGAGTILVLRQANNATARPDKGANYVGSGIFLEVERAISPSGSGPIWPNGNIGSDNDRLMMIDGSGRVVLYNDFDSNANNAPLQVSDYTHLPGRKFYIGYSAANDRTEMGSIDPGVAFKPVLLSCTVLTVNGALSVGSGAGVSTAITLLVSGTGTTGVAQIGVDSNVIFSSAAVTSASAFQSAPATAAAAYTVPIATHYNITDWSKGAGSAITSQIGLFVPNLTAGANNYAIYSNVAAAANKWNIYALGTATNYMAGGLGIGTGGLAPTELLSLGLAGVTAGRVGFAGLTSGTVVVAAPAVANGTLTLPSVVSGTVNLLANRVQSTASSATPSINTDQTDHYSITALAVAITSMTTNLTGTPVAGQKLHIDITGTAGRAITWGASFEASTVALPATTVGTARLDMNFVWNPATSKWRILMAA